MTKKRIVEAVGPSGYTPIKNSDLADTVGGWYPFPGVERGRQLVNGLSSTDVGTLFCGGAFIEDLILLPFLLTAQFKPRSVSIVALAAAPAAFTAICSIYNRDNQNRPDTPVIQTAVTDLAALPSPGLYTIPFLESPVLQPGLYWQCFYPAAITGSQTYRATVSDTSQAGTIMPPDTSGGDIVFAGSRLLNIPGLTSMPTLTETQKNAIANVTTLAPSFLLSE